MLLKDFKINKNDIIQPGKIQTLVKHNKKICYFHCKNLFKIPNDKNLYSLFMLGDNPFTENIFNKLNNIKIIATNNEVNNNIVSSLPLGITDTNWCPIIGNLDVIIEQFNKPKILNKKLLYKNFNIRMDNSYKYRKPLDSLFNHLPWVTVGKFERSHSGHKKFIEEIYNHKFILCPWGCGIDTHRLWMSLYLGSIPITLYHPTYKQFRHLPIIFVNNWNEITEDFLNKKYEEIMNKEYDFSILTMTYWKELLDTLT